MNGTIRSQTPLWDRLHPQEAAERDWTEQREYTFGAVYTGLADVETRVEEDSNLLGVMNDALGDLMEEQGAQLADMKEMNLELAETNESIQLIWTEIGRLYEKIDRQENINHWVWLGYAVLASVTLTSLAWWWRLG